MTEIDDQLLEQFFQPAKQMVVEDNGFTERVMKYLPDRSVRLSHYWTAFCLLLGVVLFVVFKGWEPLMMFAVTLLKTDLGNLHPVPFFLVMGVLSCLAVLELVRKMERMQV